MAYYTYTYLSIMESALRFSSIQSCPTLWDPVDCRTPGFPVLHHLLEFAQTQVHWVSDAIQPSHPLSPSSLAISLSQHQGLFKGVSSSGGQSIGVSTLTSVLPVNTQDWFPLGWTGWISLHSKGLSRVFSRTTSRQADPYRQASSLKSLWL